MIVNLFGGPDGWGEGLRLLGLDSGVGLEIERAIRLSVEDALVLQSFRPDYPLQGNKTSKHRQIGDAVPPLLAAHVLAVLGVPAP